MTAREAWFHNAAVVILLLDESYQMNDLHLKKLEAYSHAVRSKRKADAHAILVDIEQDASFWRPLAVSMRAEWLADEGRFDAGIKMLSSFIESGGDLINGCLNRRASLHMEHRQFAEAKRDYREILNSRIPHAITYFHSTAAYRIAWMLALEGDASYEELFAKCAQQEGDYFLRRIVEPADIHKLYEKQRQRMSGEA